MRQVFVLFSALFLTFGLPSCADQTYSKQIKEEEKIIKNFLVGKKIIDRVPAIGSQWAEDEYLRLTDGMYFRMINWGDTAGATVAASDIVVLRYKSYTLTEPVDSVINWSTNDFYYPVSFEYGVSSYACTAWLTAIALMQFQDSEGEIIAPAKTGFSSSHSYAITYWGVTDDSQTVTPRRYHLKLNFKK